MRPYVRLLDARAWAMMLMTAQETPKPTLGEGRDAAGSAREVAPLHGERTARRTT